MCDCFFIMRIYNTKLWLCEAIDSILNQTNPALKLFLFDNGSTDGCKEICEAYQKSDSRVIVYRTEENRHYSDKETQMIIRDAFEKSGALYFAILDSDDKYNERFLEIMLKTAKKERADITIAGWEKIDCTGKKSGKKIKPPAVTISDKKLTYEEMVALYDPFHTMWNKLYHKSIYPVYFEVATHLPSNALNGGDIYMMRYILTKAKRIACIPAILHEYRWRHTSATYVPIAKSEWLYLAPMREYIENKRFLGHFLFSTNDKKKIKKWNDKATYSQMKFVCNAIVNDLEESGNRKLELLYNIIRNNGFREVQKADWRNAILIRENVKKVETRYNLNFKKSYLLTVSDKKTWNSILAQSSFLRRRIYHFRMRMVDIYLKIRK